jgi:hypothetical protein
VAAGVPFVNPFYDRFLAAFQLISDHFQVNTYIL